MQDIHDPTESQALTMESRRDIARLMHWVGVAILGSVLVTVLFQAWPVALIQPTWLQKMTNALLGSGVTALMGALLLAAAPLVDPQAERLARRARLARRLASWAAIGYVLLIPVQLYAGVKQLSETRRTQTRTIEQVRDAVKGIEESTTIEQLRKAYGQIPGRKPAAARGDQCSPRPGENGPARSARAQREPGRNPVQRPDEHCLAGMDHHPLPSHPDAADAVPGFCSHRQKGPQPTHPAGESAQWKIAQHSATWTAWSRWWPQRHGAWRNGVDIPQEWIPEEEQVTK